MKNCPRCNNNTWDIEKDTDNCYCKNCHSVFSIKSVNDYWNKYGKSWTEMTPCELCAIDEKQTRKPKPMREKLGEYPYRCPICKTKHLRRDGALDCINVCWNKVKEIRLSLK